MNKINIHLKGAEAGKAGNGREFTKFQTNAGDICVFDTEIIKLLMPFLGKTVNVDMEQNAKGYNEIKAFNGEGNPNTAVDSVTGVQPNTPVVTTTMQPVKEALVNKNYKTIDRNATMYTSYAKDIFNGLISMKDHTDNNEATMEAAINLVQKARKCFEELK